MLKLPPLQPHLTGTNSDEAHKCSYQLSSTEILRRPASEPTLGSPGIPGLKTRSWKEQSEAVTDKLKEAKSRSPSTIAQIRLQEALHECSLISGCSGTESGKPHRLRTAVCCKLLEELSALAGPYSNMLQVLCKEMVASTYSDCFAHDGSKDRMDQLPYFSIVEKLEKQNSVLMAERQKFQSQLDVQLSNMSGLSTQIQTLSGALQTAEARNTEQEALLVAAKSRERQASTDAEVARTAIQDARAEISKLSSDASSTQEAMQAAINSLQQLYDEAAAAQATAERSLRIREEEVAQLHTLLQGMIKRTEVEELDAELRELQIQLPELQETIRQQNEELAALGERTPRPEWNAQRRLLPECEQHIVPISRQASKPTAVVATKLVGRLSHYASQLEEAARDRDHLQMMLVPDPVQLKLSLDFDFTGHSQQVVVQALGCGGDVPRVLRATGQAHKDRDPMAALLYQALHGHLSTHAVQRMASVVQAMEALFERMSSMTTPDASAQGCFSWEDVAMLLQRLLPGMSADVRAILEELCGSCMAGQYIQVRDLLVPGEDRTEPHWGSTDQQRAVAQHGMDSDQPGLPSHAASVPDTGDGPMPTTSQDSIANQPEHLLEEQEPAERAVPATESTADDQGGEAAASCEGAERSESVQHAVGSASSRAEKRHAGTLSDSEPWSVVVRMLSHHAGALLQLQRALSTELRGFEDKIEAGAAAHADVHAMLEAHMPHAQASACAVLWLETVSRTGSVREANLEVLVGGPLQCKGDLDVGAAETWLQGLLEQGGGHSSLAALPQVA